MKKEIRAAIRLLEDAEYVVVPPEEVQVSLQDFEIWWNLYDKKRDKEKCKKAWVRMTREERELAFGHTPPYVESTPQKEFRKDPYSYLYNKAWENEIIRRDNKEQQREQRIKAAARLVAEYAESDSGTAEQVGDAG